MEVLLSAGDHEPTMPSIDVVGNAAKASPEHIGATAANVGVVTAWFTIMVSVVSDAHWPASGVKVYTVVAVLSNAGDHVPVMPLVEVVGKAVRASPAHIGATGLNAGAVPGVTVTVTASW